MPAAADDETMELRCVRAEGVVLSRDGELGKSIVEGRLADVGETDDSHLQVGGGPAQEGLGGRVFLSLLHLPLLVLLEIRSRRDAPSHAKRPLHPKQLRKRRRKKSDKENLKKNSVCRGGLESSQGEGGRGHCSSPGRGVVALVEHHEGHLEGEIDEGGEEQLSGRRGIPPHVEPVRHPQQIPDG